MSKIDIGIPIDVEKLMETRMLVEADSGSGKSWMLRKIAEELSGKVQQVLIDPEGDFITLREKFPFALVAKVGSDIPLSIRYAEALAHKILETGISVIIDLYEFKQHEREQFVKAFAEALINAPKSMRNACVVYIDEAQLFCPEDKRAVSTNAVIDLCTRGRKRGLCTILATLRISILNKSAAAQCKNKFMGSTSLLLDQKRVGEELGFNHKEAIEKLRNLDNGEFYAFGPAISKEIIKFKVSKVKTTHVGSGVKLASLPPTPAAIKKILSKLEAIPEEAEKELDTKKKLQDEIKRLQGELRSNKIAVSPDNPKVWDDKLKLQVAQLQADIKEEQRLKTLWSKLAVYRGAALDKVVKMIKEVPDVVIEPAKKQIIKTTEVVTPFRNGTLTVPRDSAAAAVLLHHPKNATAIPVMSSQSGAMRMLKAAAMFHPNPISRTRMGAFARLSHTSGSFGTYISSLRSSGYLVGGPQEFKITESGLEAAGEVDALPTDPQELINLWCGIIGESTGSARMLRALGESYPNEMTKEELGQAVSMTHTSGSFGTYLSYLRSRGLIKTTGKTVVASEELFL